MKKKIWYLFLAIVLLCTACGNEEEDKSKPEDLQAEIEDVLANAAYDNLEICFDDIANYEGQVMEIANISVQYPDENLSYEETMKLYVEEVIPSLFDMEEIDKSLIYDADTKIEVGENRIWSFEKDYEKIMATIDSYNAVPRLIYEDVENWREITYTGNWLSGVYISQGILGSYAESMSPFSAYRMVEEGILYDCRFDDLSTSYTLLDGEKSLADAKEEIEDYLDAHYPVTGIENGIQNEVYQIEAGKITGTDYYAFKVYRTLSYNGIPFREMPSSQDVNISEELCFMAEGAMCESDKMDVTIGLINVFSEPEVERIIEEYVPFQEVMDGVAYYLTGETKFQLLYGGLEYRVYKTGDIDYQLVPYWCFIAKNPNDDSMIKIYVDMETGEIEHYGY